MSFYYANKCTWCGKFFSSKDYDKGAYYKLIPDSEYSEEDMEYCCIKCNKDNK